LGIANVDEAAAACAARQTLESQIRAESTLLNELGAAKIEEEWGEAQSSVQVAEAEVQRRATGGEELTVPENLTAAQVLRATIEAERQRLEDEEQDFTVQVAALRELSDKADRDLAQRQQKSQSAHDQLTALDAQLRLLLGQYGDDDPRSARLVELRSAKQKVSELLAATRQTLTGLQPDLLIDDHQRIERALKNSQEARQRAITRREVARSRLQTDGGIDPKAGVATAEARVGQATERLSSVQANAKAMQLLQKLFSEEKQALSEQLTRPLANRITGYLQCLFGTGATVEMTLEEDAFIGLRMFRPDRNRTAIEFDNLSVGTQEQLAAAVRLAIAEVLAADHDRCLPVVFDDAFTNSDPERVALLQRMLDRGARQGLQIIVLSCSPADYTTLGATCISLRSEPLSPGHLPGPFPAADAEPETESAELDDDDWTDIPGNGETRPEQIEELMAVLRQAGGKLSRQSLQAKLGWDPETFNQVKATLAASGRLKVQRGRNGGIFIPDA
jgi:hypothetical protein